MRSLQKNKQEMYYALYDKRVPTYKRTKDGELVIDEKTGKPIETGKSIDTYKEPVLFYANISAGKSIAEAEPFGVSVDYDRVISTTDLDLPITETSLIWKEVKPVFKEDGSLDPLSADYRVAARPAKSLNQLLIAIRKNEKDG